MHTTTDAYADWPITAHLRAISSSKYFRNGIFLAVIADIVCIAQETQSMAYAHSMNIPAAFQHLELIFMSIYLTEFLIKFIARPFGYWKEKYNRLDFIILVMGLVQLIVTYWVPDFEDLAVLRIMRSLRALRAFRGISFMRSLQVVVEALINTLRNNVVDIIILLLLIMFIFGVLGHYLFAGDPSSTSHKDWGTLGDSFMTLFIYVCADGWLPYQETLSHDGFVGSELFTAFFIFIGNFIIANMFIGVICQNIDDATRIDKEEQAKKKREARLIKREVFLRRQQQDISELLAQTGKGEEDNFQDIVKEMVGTLRHEDVVPMSHINCNLTWLETFSVTLTHRENTLYRIQQLQFGIANCLAEYVDQRLNSRTKQDP
ncbi:Ion transport protein-domain-containing protein [Obelidium mucronatum]|nr:Ion transport protein-domain-containing protein [Obelidium mucronatum]